jgi:hypothetical protein
MKVAPELATTVFGAIGTVESWLERVRRLLAILLRRRQAGEIAKTPHPLASHSSVKVRRRIIPQRRVIT